MVSVKRTLQSTTALTSASLALLLLASPASANPQDGQVVAGDATIITPDPSTLLINQYSQNVVLEWGSFDIDAGETTTFVQPNIDAWALNRVVGSQDPSVIAGTLNANGNIAIVNPDGIVFSHGSRIDVGGLIATTADIDNDAFMRSELSFNLPGNPAASVINEGTVSVRDHGLAAFVAPGVRNSGVITARYGTVSLASGNTFALDLYGDGLISLAIGDEITEEVIDVATGEVMADLVRNEGTISANGGTVALTAATARTAVNSVINNTGVIEANSVGMRNGKIILGAQTATSRPASAPPQTVRVSGTLRTTAVTTSLRPAARPGTIEITGEDIQIAGATLDASGTNGGGTILIGGDYLGGQEISDLFPVGEEVREDYEVATAATLTVDGATTIDASATENGDGGKIILWSDVATTTSAEILAFGAGDGTGGFIETSSAGTLSLPKGFVSAGQGGTWLLDPLYLIVQDFDNEFSDTRHVSAQSISSALNHGSNVRLKATGGLTAGLSVNNDIIKTSGGDAQLLLGSTGSIAINADITSKSGQLEIGISTGTRGTEIARVGLDFADERGTQYRPLPSGTFELLSGHTINTNGGDFVFKGASFQVQSDLIFTNGTLTANAAPGRISTEGGSIGLFFSPASVSGSGYSGFIGCFIFEIACSAGSPFTLDAGRGQVLLSLDSRFSLSGPQDAPELFVSDFGIRTESRLTLDNVVVRPFGFDDPNGVSNVAAGSVSERNNAALRLHSEDVDGIENTSPFLTGITLPDVTLRPGETWGGLDLQTLFSDNDGAENLEISLSGDPVGLPLLFRQGTNFLSTDEILPIERFEAGDIAPGTYTVTITATDGFTQPVSTSFRLIVPAPPAEPSTPIIGVSVENPGGTERFAPYRPDSSIDDKAETSLDALLESIDLIDDSLDLLTGNDLGSILGQATYVNLVDALSTRKGQEATDELLAMLFDQNSNLEKDAILKIKAILEDEFDVEITSDVGTASEMLEIAMTTRSQGALVGRVNGIQMAILLKAISDTAGSFDNRSEDFIGKFYDFVTESREALLCPGGVCSFSDTIPRVLNFKGLVGSSGGYQQNIRRAKGRIEASVGAITAGAAGKPVAAMILLGKELMFGTTTDDEIFLQDSMVALMIENRDFDELERFSKGEVFSLEPRVFGLGVRETKVTFKDRYPDVYDFLQSR